jgi:catechol 2,3-dioxygenase-like lactoylglutathione lyase family enzyme
VTREKWDHLRGNLDAAGVEYLVESEKSIYVRDPDGARLELLARPARRDVRDQGPLA